MRLIDADLFLEFINAEMKQNRPDDLHIRNITRVLEDLPTAYDIDKVVKELEEQINKCNAELTPDCDTVKMLNLCGRRQAFIEVISIIKRQVE